MVDGVHDRADQAGGFTEQVTGEVCFDHGRGWSSTAPVVSGRVFRGRAAGARRADVRTVPAHPV